MRVIATKRDDTLASASVRPSPLGVLAAVLLLWATTAGAVAAQQERVRHGGWLGFELGYGELRRRSVEDRTSQRGTFSLGVRGGVTLQPWLRLGLFFKGWSLEAANLHNPAKGEAVNEAGLEARMYPRPRGNVFVQMTAARSSYFNNRPGEFNSRGWGGGVGIGIELPLPRAVRATAAIGYHAGSLRSVRNAAYVSTRRRYRVLDLSVGVSYH